MSRARSCGARLILLRGTIESYLALPGALAACFRRSAQRRFIASAIRFLPSGLSLRLRDGVDTTAVFAFLLPFGRPGPLLVFVVAIPESNSLARWSLDISESISAIIRLTSIGVSPYCGYHSSFRTASTISSRVDMQRWLHSIRC
jgi:hypothetical protein